MASEFEFDFEMPNSFYTMLDRVSSDVALKAIHEGLKVGGDVIAKRAAELAPRGEVTGSSKKQSKSYKARYNNKPLHKKIKFAVRKYQRVAIAVVGAIYPDGNEIFPLLAGHRFIRWNKQKIQHTNPAMVMKADNFLRKAFFETRVRASELALDKAGQVIQKAMGGN